MKTEYAISLLGAILILSLLAISYFKAPKPVHNEFIGHTITNEAPSLPLVEPVWEPVKITNFTPEIASIRRLTHEEFIQRTRDHALDAYLSSPARGTPAAEALEHICREHGFDQWMVTPAYHIAWEETATERLMQAMIEKGTIPTASELIIDMREQHFRVLVETTEKMYDVELGEDFLAAVRMIRPEVFFGQGR